MNPLVALLMGVIGFGLGLLVESAADRFVQRYRPEHAAKARSWRRPAHFRLLCALTVGALFTIFGLRYHVDWQLIGYAAMAWLFILLAIIDLKYRIIPNPLILVVLVITLLVNVLVLQLPLERLLIGAVFAFGIFYAVATLRPGGLGMGDVKLSALIGLTFGFPSVLWVLIVSAGASAVTIVTLLTLRRQRLGDSIPYAPFLCLGALVMLVISTRLTL